MSVLKAGLIGCGRIAQLLHFNILKRLPHVELVALSNVVKEDKREKEQAVAG